MGAEQENQEILFARTLEQVREQAAEQGGVISEEQVREAFDELSLSEQQLQLVFDYLKKHKIGLGEKPKPEEYLSQEERDYLKEYRRQLAHTEKVSDGQRQATTLSAMAGERQAQQQLIHLYLPQVAEIAQLYVGQGVFLEDLIGEGNVALTTGVTMLGCLEHPDEAEAMLVRLIMDSMEESIAQYAAQEEKDREMMSKVNLVAEKAREMAKDLRRKVTVRELAEETGMSLKSIEDAVRISGFAIEDISYE